ncbi:MAG: HipA family kinase [Ignavibacteria bacterium]
MKTNTAKRIIKVLRTGSSLPLVVENKGGIKYFVKLNRGMSNPYAGITEYTASGIGNELGLPVTKPEIMLIDKTADMSLIDQEVRDMVKKSFGYNLAFPYLENITDWKFKEKNSHDPVFNDLFIFDLILLNIDRTKSNSNILLSENKLISFDYEISMLVLGIVQRKDFHLSDLVLKQLKQNPFYYEPIKEDSVRSFQEKMKNIDIRKIISELPVEWLSQNKLDALKLSDDLYSSFKSELYFEILERLPAIKEESNEERKKRLLNNKIKFEKTSGLNLGKR